MKRCESDAALLKAGATGHSKVNPSAGIDLPDREAKQEYSKRRDDLLYQLEEAQQNNDMGRQERLQEQLEAINRQLAVATGFRDRTRRTKDEKSNLRTSLTNAIDRTVRKIQPIHADFARHLDNANRKGNSFCYSPETDLEWDLQTPVRVCYTQRTIVTPHVTPSL